MEIFCRIFFACRGIIGNLKYISVMIIKSIIIACRVIIIVDIGLVTIHYFYYYTNIPDVVWIIIKGSGIIS